MGVDGLPLPLDQSHDRTQFDSGVPLLDDWIKTHGLRNQSSGGSRTFVVTRESRVVGYYALATGSVERASVPGAISRNMPEPIPIAILARLAVDSTFQGRQLGKDLLRDAMLRTLHVSHHIGIRALLVHAISAEAETFYLRYGFRLSPTDPNTLLISLSDMRRHLAG